MNVAPDTSRDHGGRLAEAVARHGGRRRDWIDLSTGIAPIAYPIGRIPGRVWAALPDSAETAAIINAARRFWSVPDAAAILVAPGASSVIARIPQIVPVRDVWIPGPTYNEHAAAFAAAGWTVCEAPAGPGTAAAAAIVNPNNPDGRIWRDVPTAPLTVIDESFCEVTPTASLIRAAARPGTLVLKSFGKFWGLAGLRLGFAVGDPGLIARLAEALGPWPVSGPALAIGARALRDQAWADDARDRCAADAARLDAAMARVDPRPRGTDLFRLYAVGNSAAWLDHLARHRILARSFPWSAHALRLGLPAPVDWPRVEAALAAGP